MRLVWVVIPLVLIGIVGIQESFAQYMGNVDSDLETKPFTKDELLGAIAGQVSR